MTATAMAEAETSPRPAEQIWCLVCRGWRPYRCEPVPAASRFSAVGFDSDILVCAGCRTTLLIVRATQDTHP